MNAQVASSNSSTLQEWASFLNVLNGNKDQHTPLLKKAESAQRIVMHLEKQFSKVETQPIFRRLGKHTQLVLTFS
ncbi:hypothetical protein [Aurantibacillus circumpalustris]|uniref:hypothetical protein n=1 Tax=Aurantibacillus circumpalustris TaxID=3036359 RepID=UPI00295BAF45|nr:hypothetical protein [Aurantibacillus circumpalustris]